MFADELRGHIGALHGLIARLATSGVAGDEAVVLGALFAELERLAGAGGALVREAVGAGRSDTEAEPAAASDAGSGGATSDAAVPSGATSDAAVPSGAGAGGDVGAGKTAGTGGSGGSVGGGTGGGITWQSAGVPVSAAGPWQPVDDAALAVGRPAWPGSAAPLERYAHDQRFLQVVRDPRGGVRGSFWLTASSWDRLAPHLGSEAARRLDSARSSGHFESKDQYLADALVALCLAGVAAGDRGGGVDAGPAPVEVAPGRPAGPSVCVVPGCGQAGEPVGADEPCLRPERPAGADPGNSPAAAALCDVHRDHATYRGWHLHRRGPGWAWASPSHCRTELLPDVGGGTPVAPRPPPTARE